MGIINTSQIVGMLDLDLAWKRVRFDYKQNRVFVEHPYERQLIESDLSGWLASVRNILEKDRYFPEQMQICDAPKLGDTIRPGGILCSIDHLVYVALVGALYKKIQEGLKPYQGVIEYSYPLSEDPNDPKWIKFYRESHAKWSTDSLSILEEDEYEFMVQTDISAYYEYVDLRTLQSDLNETGADTILIQALFDCLKSWSQGEFSNRGLPQGYYASDMLAKLYLNQIDKKMQTNNYRLVRYVDDYRIFCKTISEARRAIILFSELLRSRGLTLSSAKTEILTAERAQEKINFLTQLFKGVADELGIFAHLYIPGFGFVESDEEETPSLEVLEKVYTENFIEVDLNSKKFNKSLFRYILKCLKKHKCISVEVASHCLECLSLYPSETEHIIPFFSELNYLNKSWLQARLSQFLKSDSAVYDHQIYVIFWGVTKSKFQCKHDNLVGIARSIVFDRNKPAYLRSVCRKFLGKFAPNSVLDEIRASYVRDMSELEICEIILAVQRMEKSKRNQFYGSINNQFMMIGRAIKMAKEM